MNITVVDNYDSFTYNLVQMLAAEGADVTVFRNDAVTRRDIAEHAPDGIILSPGPGHPRNPRDVGVCMDLLADPLDAPVLGVCLGMQAMAHATGGDVVHAPTIVHGEADTTTLSEHPLFQDIGHAAQVGRYHSLCVDPGTLPDAWEQLGSTADGTLMAMAHRDFPWMGVQFHPESILTPMGPTLLKNFLRMCGP